MFSRLVWLRAAEKAEKGVVSQGTGLGQAGRPRARPLPGQCHRWEKEKSCSDPTSLHRGPPPLPGHVPAQEPEIRGRDPRQGLRTERVCHTQKK